MQKNNKHIRYIKNDRLPVIKPGYKGNKLIDNKFANGNELYLPDFKNVIRWKLTTNPQKKEKAADHYTPQVHTGNHFVTSTEDMIVWLGHATFFIRVNGITFITDPIFYDLPLIQRRVALPCPPSQLQDINYMLLSHGHRDHLDEKSVKTLFNYNPGMKAMIPLRAGEILRGIARELPYQEAGWYQQYDLIAPGVEVYYLPASHWHRRGLFDMNKVLWGSFLIKTEKITIYFAGDSGLNDHFGEIEQLFGPIDICIMPVGAYKPPFMMQKSHMNPHEAVKAFNQLRGGTFIPMHYGTYDLSDEPAGEPIRILEQLAAGGILQDLRIPAIGEPVLLQPFY